MRKFFKYVFFIIFFSTFLSAVNHDVNLTQEEKQYLKENPIIKYTSDPNWLPYEAYDKNGNHIGVISDILKLIEEKIDVEFEVIVNESWDEALSLAASNKIDMITSDPSDKVLKQNFNYISSYLKNSIVIVMRNDNKYISNLNYISDKKIAVVEEYGYIPDLKLAYPDIDFIYVQSIKDGLEGVSKGKFDVFLSSIASATYNISNLALGNLSIVGKTDVDMKVTFFVHKNKEILLHIINKVSSSFGAAEINKIMDKWIVKDYVEKIDYRLIIEIVIVFSILILISLFWNTKLAISKNRIEDLNLKLEEKVEELEHLSITDGMTDLYNRRHFDVIFEQELHRCQRNKNTLVFTLFDVDKFKQYNDTYGHDRGDKVLISIAQVMKSVVHRANDFVFRVGGEEFCLITSEINEEEASSYINSLRQKIEDLHIEHELNPASKYVTASFGLIILNFENKKDFTVDEIYKMADNALYRAKESGRNKIDRVTVN